MLVAYPLHSNLASDHNKCWDSIRVCNMRTTDSASLPILDIQTIEAYILQMLVLSQVRTYR